MSPASHAGLAVAVAFSLLAAAATADTGTSLGDRSGEGATPFTGLAQSPEANLFTGSLTTRIPIKLPPGRKGMTPQLALHYSSAGGPSPFGFGWDLPIGRIDRSTKWGVPRCGGDHTSDFVLVLPSGSATELIEDPPGSGTFHPVVEEAWVEAALDASSNSWTVRDSAGLRYTFGDHTSARVSTNQSSPPLALQPDGSCEITSSWMLTRIDDARGSSIEIEWLEADNVAMPSRILYGGNSNGIDHFYEVQLLYLLRPPQDFVTSHRLGVEQRLLYRLATIAVYSDVPEPDTFVRSYDFHYFDDGVSASMLSVVTATGEPTQTFAYSPPGDGHATPTQAIPVSVPPAHAYMRRWTNSLEVYDSILDMNGDGKLDLVQGSTFPWTVYFGENDGTDDFGFSATPVQWSGDNSEGSGRIRNVWVTSGPCDDNGWACTVVDTFDITGDGRPDYVVARDAAQPWRVYPGELKSDGTWGFSQDPLSWPAPDRMIRRTKNGHTYRDTVDVNGDGLPDFVDVNGGQWSVWLNHGLGFETQPLPYFPAPLTSTVLSSDGSTKHMLADFDGDGLQDLLQHLDAGDTGCEVGTTHQHDCLVVHRNTGQGFETSSATYELPLWVDGLTVEDGDSVVADLIDVNGDGLPDWVEQSDDGLSWNVLLNRGGALSPVAYEASPPHDAYVARVWPGGSGPLRKRTGNRTEIDMVDLNGDGFLDRVAAGDAQWEVQLNLLTQKPNVLWMMENGLGGTNTIVYVPSSRFDHSGGDDQPDLPFVTWAVSATRLNDGLCTPPPQANPFDRSQNPCIDQGHEILSFFDYQDGRFAVDYRVDGSGTPVDVIDRGFYGFRRVTRADVDGSETASVFGQTALVRGRLLELYYYAGNTESGALVRYEVNSWSSRIVSPLRDQVWLGQNGRFTFDLGASTPRYVVTTNHDVDEYGNVLHTSVLGTQRSRIDTYTTYAVPFGSNGCFARNRPATSRTEDAGGVLDQRQYLYDGAALGALSVGNLSSTRAWLDTESVWVTTEFEYDANSNLVLTRDPGGIEATITYDDGSGTFLYPTIETNAAGHQSIAVMDYRYGKTALRWGANGISTATLFAYDQAGRLICEARPGDSLSACTFATTYDFADGPGQTSSVTVERKQSGYAVGRTTTTHFDALGRERFSDVRSVVNGVVTTIRRDQVELDAAGRVREKFYPYPASAGTPSNGSTRFDYSLNGTAYSDPFGRLHQTLHSDGRSTRTSYFGSRVVTLDEEGNRTERLHDALDRVVREEVYQGGTVYSSIDSEFDGMGRLTALYQNDDGTPLKSFTYDSLGRRTAVSDRDSGTWLYGYDHVGNLLYRDDPKQNQHTQYCYDDVGRVVRACSLLEDFHTLYSCSVSCDPQETTYTYDDPSVPFSRGRLSEVSDEAGAFRVLEYDARGRQVVSERDIDVDGDVTTARFEYAYNDTDEVVEIRYPDGEVVTTNYDAAGRPVGLQNDSGEVYIDAVWYDAFGRANSIWHGNGARDDRSYFDQAERHRLSAIATSIGGAIEISHLYQYTPRGQIAAITDFDTGPRSNSAVYQYDPLGRLIGYDHFHDSLDRTYQYDSWGNITHKGGTTLAYGDPQQPSVHPHQIVSVDGQPVAYDANGNRTTNGAGAVYGFDGEDRLETITVDGAVVELLYDHESKRRVRIVDDGTSRQVTRYYNDLVHTTADGETVKSYFLGGVRVATNTVTGSTWEGAAVAGGAVRFATVWQGRPILLLELDGRAQTAALLGTVLLLLALAVVPRRRSKRVVGIRVQRGPAAGMAMVFAVAVLPWPLAVRPAAAQCGGPTPTPAPSQSIVHLHSDHLGSTQMITSESGEILEHIRYLPYGEVRGRWDGDGTLLGAEAADESPFGFTGHELEASSGLIYAGARFYDPALASFLTPDPAGEFTSPYSYVGWDPINGNDPTGECELLCVLAVTALIGFLLGAAEAALAGADLGEALKAGLISGATSAVGAAVLGPAGSALESLDGWGRAVSEAIRLAGAGYGIYTTVESFRDGEYLAGARGALQILSAAFGGLADSDAGVGAKQSRLPALASFLTDSEPVAGPATPRIGTLPDNFPPPPPGGAIARIKAASLTIFGIKIEVGTAWAIDSAGNRRVFDIFSIGVESEVMEVTGSEGLLISDAVQVDDLAGTSTSIGGSGGPNWPAFGAEYTVGEHYSGVTLYTGASYGIAPIGAYGIKETWTPRSP